jgi:hypothetical protein
VLTDDDRLDDRRSQHMRNMCTSFRCLVVVISVFGCSSNNNSKTVDAAPVVDAFYSMCGEPGDVGDPDGVGKFCQSGSDCLSSAPLCSVIGSKTTFFCTHLCTFGSAGTCDADDTCTCEGSNNAPPCACTPTKCLGSD